MIWSGWWKVYAASSNNSRKQEVSNYSHCAPCSMVIYKIFSIWSQYSISQCNEFNVRYFVTKIGHPASFEGSTPKNKQWHAMTWCGDPTSCFSWTGIHLHALSPLWLCGCSLLFLLYWEAEMAGQLRCPKEDHQSIPLNVHDLPICEPSTFFLSLAYLGAEISCGHAHCHETAVFHLSKASMES